MDIFAEVLKDSNYGLTVFEQAVVEELKARVTFRSVRGEQKPYITRILTAPQR